MQEFSMALVGSDPGRGAVESILRVGEQADRRHAERLAALDALDAKGAQVNAELTETVRRRSAQAQAQLSTALHVHGPLLTDDVGDDGSGGGRDLPEEEARRTSRFVVDDEPDCDGGGAPPVVAAPQLRSRYAVEDDAPVDGGQVPGLSAGRSRFQAEEPDWEDPDEGWARWSR